MKCNIPEISWHNRDPVLSIDIQPQRSDETFFRLASGGTDSHVLIWYLRTKNSEVGLLECAADLTRHQKPVNVVRFSPSGDLLASGDDEGIIIIWKKKTILDPPNFFGDNVEDCKEQWTIYKVLRRHLQDVYDLSWSSDSKCLISGSVDNTAILWDIPSGNNFGILTDHKGFVQGVSWDPRGQYVATMTSDRFLRIFNTKTTKIVSRVSKAKLPKSDPEAKPSYLFHDDSLKTFFRRLTFTPDGKFIIVPSGVIDQPGKNPLYSTLIFSRTCLSKPVVYLPSMNQYTIAVRCCPVLFALRQMTDDSPLFALPYRVVFAVATQRSVLLYDTQHAAPIALITNLHYTRLTDLSWSNDGKILVISSTDGYCSIITFDDGELGVVYDSTKDDKQEKKQEEKQKEKQEEKIKVANKDDSKKVKSNKDDSKKVKSNKELKGKIDRFLIFQGKIPPLNKNKSNVDTVNPKKENIFAKKENFVAKTKIETRNMDLEKIKDQKYDLEGEKIEEKMDVDDDIQILEEIIPQSKLISEVDKTVADNKPILVLEKDIVDDDIHLILEETMTQSKLINEVEKTVADNKPILVLEKDSVDDDIHLILEETMTQSKLINEVDKTVADDKPILVLEKDTDKKDMKEDENKPTAVVVDKSVINITEANNKFSSLILDKVIDLDKNKPVSKVSLQKEDESNVDSLFVSTKSNTVPISDATPGQSQKKTPRRVQLITLSSPKNKK